MTVDAWADLAQRLASGESKVVWNLDPEILELANSVRHVRTPAGAQFYGQPIGSVIVPDEQIAPRVASHAVDVVERGVTRYFPSTQGGHNQRAWEQTGEELEDAYETLRSIQQAGEDSGGTLTPARQFAVKSSADALAIVNEYHALTLRVPKIAVDPNAEDEYKHVLSELARLFGSTLNARTYSPSSTSGGDGTLATLSTRGALYRAALGPAPARTAADVIKRLSESRQAALPFDVDGASRQVRSAYVRNVMGLQNTQSMPKADQVRAIQAYLVRDVKPTEWGLTKADVEYSAETAWLATQAKLQASRAAARWSRLVRQRSPWCRPLEARPRSS